MDDKALIKVLIAIIFGLITWSAHREMNRLDKQVEVLHQRVNMEESKKTDREDYQRELGFVWQEIKTIRERLRK